jgi:FlaA1/EpsC-like NDP-sugar epimerase
MDLKLLWTIFYGTTLSTLLVTAIVAIFRLNSLPRSSLGIFWIFSIVYIGATRLIARGFILGVELRVDHKKKVAIYGAGRAGSQIANALLSSREYSPIFFVDDNKELHKSSVHGLRVFDPFDIDELILKYDIQEIILAMPSSSRTRQKEIIEKLENTGVALKILPGIADVVSGKVRIDDIREVGIDDLLGRDPVPPIVELIKTCITGKIVCVTGAGGSIGSEICRQVLINKPSKLILIEINEFALYQIEKELNYLTHASEIVPILLDVSEFQKLKSVFLRFNVETIYHAAAYKHVPLVEFNPAAGVLNNSFGTYYTALAAKECLVKYFILISTDKAVRPTNVMGASKRLAELILQSFSKESPETIFSMVRFGNVLGSSGSVVPLFKEQIRNGGPITLTDRNIIRYFMTIPEASTLVIQAGAMAKGGEVFVLDMGEPVKIYDLAVRMVELSGLSVKNEENPDGDIEIVISGLRPGEKLYEELLIGNNPIKTDHPSIMKAREHSLELEELLKKLEKLKDICHNTNSNLEDIKTQLKDIVIEYNPV